MTDPRPRISLIAALDRRGTIGKDGDLPWHLPADLSWFKARTRGKPVVMGRRTWDSLPKALPGRHNIVLTRQAAWSGSGCDVAHTPEDALATAGEAAEVMILGGAAVYAAFLPMADRIYLTLVDAELPGDTRFPEIDWSRWVERQRHCRAADAKNAYGLVFSIMEARDDSEP